MRNKSNRGNIHFALLSIFMKIQKYKEDNNKISTAAKNIHLVRLSIFIKIRGREESSTSHLQWQEWYFQVRKSSQLETLNRFSSVCDTNLTVENHKALSHPGKMLILAWFVSDESGDWEWFVWTSLTMKQKYDWKTTSRRCPCSQHNVLHERRSHHISPWRHDNVINNIKEISTLEKYWRHQK